MAGVPRVRAAAPRGILTAAGALALAAFAVAPAQAAGNRPPPAGQSASAVPTSALTSQQQATMAELVEAEKLAYDLYTTFDTRFPGSIFGVIASSEAQHVTAVRTLLSRYQLADPSAGQPAGAFTSPAVQALYDSLLAQGSAGLGAALGVGVAVELKDIDDLEQAMDGLAAQDVLTAYQHLPDASNQHLRAFQALV